jgi:hypothetical protein
MLDHFTIPEAGDSESSAVTNEQAFETGLPTSPTVESLADSGQHAGTR